MRRPVVFLAGLVVAGGASLALAGPAAASSSASSYCYPGAAYSNEYNVFSNNGNVNQDWSLIDGGVLSGLGLGILGNGSGSYCG
ncbi:hypothetical protein BJ973_003500 [Actinoplanes tereljensis]|uniref:Uncharacterized protein n=1 Tax=Paractinoplanes tereljensis TaxID=571912 RepID=A0A919NW02_9ACTN|nr:hypothetical protein [Actinoplanes tereljensis]GIF26230.1 hypothetical protein Ate02nite_89600 [Actinoplanes tereljensis]